jgi:ethanolamine ammonia-lyase large subunit
LLISDSFGLNHKVSVKEGQRQRQLQLHSLVINLALLAEAHSVVLSLGRGTVGRNVMYFETGHGSALPANAHHGVDQQTCEARACTFVR